MKLVIFCTAVGLGLSAFAFAAEPPTDHSEHQQQAKPAAPQQPQQGAAQAAPQGHMQHHQGMKMEGCCCKKDAQGKMSCDDKADAPAGQEHDHSKH